MVSKGKLRVGDELKLQMSDGAINNLRLIDEVKYQGKVMHIFQPIGAPERTNLIVMEYVGRVYKPVIDGDLLKNTLLVYFTRGAGNG